MNTRKFPNGFAGLLAAAPSLLPALALAHPGHYHPGEEDEFDMIRSNFLHLHGGLEIGLASVALIAFLIFRMSMKPSLRMGAIITFGGSIALLAAV